MARQSHTLTETVFQQIRGDILSGEHAPGARLRFAEMCARYGTSVGVVREALSRLAEQGLVQSEPQLGFCVTPVSLEGLLELTDARCEIEGLVFRRSVQEGDLDWESAVVASHHTLQRTPTRIDGHFNQSWGVAHAAFHTTLLDGCPNRRLLNMALAMRDAAEVYRRAWQRPVGDNALRDVAAEHKRLMDIAVARDVELAFDAIGQHIRATTDYMVQHSPEAIAPAEASGVR